MGEGLFSTLMRLEGQDYQSPESTSQLNLPPPVDPALKALQLTEALRKVLEDQRSEEEQHSLRKQVCTDTAHIILKWLDKDEVSTVSLTHLRVLNTWRGMDDGLWKHYVTQKMQIVSKKQCIKMDSGQWPVWEEQVNSPFTNVCFKYVMSPTCFCRSLMKANNGSYHIRKTDVKLLMTSQDKKKN